MSSDVAINADPTHAESATERQVQIEAASAVASGIRREGAKLVVGHGAAGAVRRRRRSPCSDASTIAACWPRETEMDAVPTVAVIHPTAEKPDEELVLPGTLQAFEESPIYARTNGYLLRWYKDIGSHITQGELLAKIDTPEVDQELLQARAARQQVTGPTGTGADLGRALAEFAQDRFGFAAGSRSAVERLPAEPRQTSPQLMQMSAGWSRWNPSRTSMRRSPAY